uniref:Uncharacterized protein n=1 Tax=Chenopodium quinoa TaxID=63459 RepID=A0A803N0T9_CHEQI
MVKFGSLCSKALAYPKSTTVVLQALQLLDLEVDEKIVVATKKGLVGTPSSVCREKGNDCTPSTQRQGSCDPQNGEDPIIPKDPPLPKRLAHHTTDSRYKSCLEKPRKTAKTSKTTQGKKNKESQAAFTTPSSSTMHATPSNMVQHHPYYQYSPHSAGGIQMVDMDGSIGYFTSVGSGVQQFNGSYIYPRVATFLIRKFHL